VAGFGPVPPGDARALAAHLAARPGSRCLTLTDSDGRAVAHGCATIMASGGRGRGGSESPDPPLGGSASGGRGCGGGDTGRRPPPTSTGPPGSPGWELTVTIRPLAVGTCDHTRGHPGYQVPERLRHVLQVRQRSCAFPGCRRAAARCDQDHTLAYAAGGRTCECNLAPLCRKHHSAKQTAGWQLEQPQPGVLIWHPPHGRTYQSQPDRYDG
jgi:hypothetical protein